VWLRCKRVCLLLFLLILMLSAVLGSDAPTLSKIADLPDNSYADTHTIRCMPSSFTQLGADRPQAECTYLSSLGRLTTSGRIVISADQTAMLVGPTSQSFFIPTPGSVMTLLSLRGTTAGNHIGIYRGLSQADVHPEYNLSDQLYYGVDKLPDFLLTDPATKKPLQINTADIFFSNNGLWMIASRSAVCGSR
jgi:hypothetical protein